MITKITKLKNYGIFRDFKPDQMQDFGKINLIFGWNGSGKSTLSTIFESLEKGKNLKSDSDPVSEFSVSFNDGSNVTEKTIQQSTKAVRTFNEGFIKDNIDWNNSVKSILLIAKEKIEERKLLEKLKTDQKKSLETTQKTRDLELKATTELQKFLTDSAKRTKSSLQVIGTDDSHYLNYNRTKLENFINNNAELIKDPASILKNEELVELVVAARPESKPSLSPIPNTLALAKLTEAASRLEGLLKTTATNIVLDRLRDNPDIQHWVQAGLSIHATHSSDSCEFCGTALDTKRIDEINAHFSDEYKKFQTRLMSAEQWLIQQRIDFNGIDLEELLYEEFREKFITLKENLSKQITLINSTIEAWKILLNEKINDPFRTNFEVPTISEPAYNSLGVALDEINKIITTHNKKTADFAQETGQSKKKIELHYAALEVKDFTYFSKISKRDGHTKQLTELGTQTQSRQKEIERLEATLSNEALGAEQFNAHLKNFLGRDDLRLRFNPQLLGYQIIRGEESRHAKNLSEGEKTAIAFVYFITKLSEGDVGIDKLAVIVDDPISSFDSNHLFHAYSFLRYHCDKAAQLFVLTHNFNFFKLIRDWLHSTNSNRSKKQKVENCFFYVVEASTGYPRTSQLKNAPKSLHDYNSEYHYLFGRLYAYHAKREIDRDEAFLTANLARKILESFFSFKYPLQKGDMAALFQQGLTGCTLTTAQTKEKIYRFINKYSHNATIELGEDSSENLIGESYNIIADVFIWISEVDRTHYDQMITVSGHTPLPVLADLSVSIKPTDLLELALPDPAATPTSHTL